MSFNAKEVPFEGGNKERAPAMDAGTYPARLVQIMVLGTQTQRPYKGDPKPPAREIALTYEFLDEFMPDDEGEDDPTRPRWLTETIPFHNLEADLAKSTKRYYAFDPDVEHDGDWSALLEAPCMVTIVVNEGKGKNAGKFYENITGVSAMRKKEADKAPALVNPTKLFDFYSPDKEVFDGLPKWLQEKLQEAVDFDGSALQELLEGGEAPVKKAAAKEERPKDDVDDDEVEW